MLPSNFTYMEINDIENIKNAEYSLSKEEFEKLVTKEFSKIKMSIIFSEHIVPLLHPSGE